MLKKRKGIYWCDFYADGKRIRQSLKTDSYYRAIDKLRLLKEKYKTESPTLDGFVKKYLDYAWVEKPISARREEQRLKKIQEFFKSVHKLTQLDEVTPYHIEQLKAHLKGKGLAKSTINRYMQIIKGMYNKAYLWRVYDGGNPVKGVRFYTEHEISDFLNDSDIEKILKSAEKMSRYPKSPLQRDFYDLCLMAINTGMRKSEILNMKWKDIKENNTVHVIGKGGKHRYVPLNNVVIDILRSRPKRYEYVFDLPNRNEGHIFRKAVEKISKETGVKWNFHLLRHYFTSKLSQNNIDLVTIRKILGHSTIVTTLRYSHSDLTSMRKAIDILSDGKIKRDHDL